MTAPEDFEGLRRRRLQSVDAGNLEADGTKVSPSHYARLEPQPITVIEAWALNFHRGQVVKYVSRAGHKGGESELDDLKKAAWYLQREIARLERE